MRKLVVLISIMICTLFCGVEKGFGSTPKYKSTNISYETADKYIINSTLTYPNIQKASYPMIVMLHSLGYSSEYWETLVDDFLHAGIAVLEIDMKGHGKSSSDIFFKRRSWIYLNDKDYQTYPSEVLDIVYNVIDSLYPLLFFIVTLYPTIISSSGALIICPVLSKYSGFNDSKLTS